MSPSSNQAITPVTNLGHTQFVYDGVSYTFTLVKSLNPSGRDKKIYFGCFEHQHNSEYISLPGGLEFDKEYCLKIVSLSFPLEQHLFPQDRHFWDFFPFKGDNLREILVLNDDAQQLVNLLTETTQNDFNQKSGALGSLCCASIEPVYSQFNINDYKTPFEKIDCIIQIISGLKQLFSHTVLNQHRIVAHRDLKFANVVVQHLADGSKRLRLIDFPSVKVQNTENAVRSNHTQIGFFSYSNTAPEDVMRRYNISEKTDVFALGAMLAEIFKIWNFGEICNPLTLLFDCTRSIKITDPKECRIFFSTLNERYGFKNKNTPGWLEQALDAHNKNAYWGEIERVCPEIRTLFRAATAIDPKNRITLNDFERQLRSIRHNLSQGGDEIVTAQTTPKKISYFLVDTLDINLHCDVYIDTICQIAEIPPYTDVAVMSFAWCHKSTIMSSSPDALDMRPLNVDDACEYIRGLEATSRENSCASKLKGCLFELSEYLKNQSNYNTFSGEIHIFTPEMPNKENSCSFREYTTDVLGIEKETYLTNTQICQRFDKNVKIYVHAYKTSGILEDAGWYTPVPFKEEPKTVTNEYSPKASQSDDSNPPTKTESPVSEPRLTKGAGFRFLGGKPASF